MVRFRIRQRRLGPAPRDDGADARRDRPARTARHDPQRRPAAETYIWTIAVAQVFWVVLAIVDLPITTTFAVALVLIGIEMLGPFIAERRKGGTPWHADHIAERYGLLVIITLGEGVIGTVASINAVVHGDAGWSVEAVVVGFAGIALIFATWWTYFVIPWAHVLRRHRERSFLWGYGHIPVFASLAAIGAELHVAAYYLEHETALEVTGTVLSTAIPFAVYTLVLYGIYAAFTRHRDPFHLTLLAGTAAVLILSVVLAALAGLAICPPGSDARPRRHGRRLRDSRAPARLGGARANRLLACRPRGQH